MDYRLGPVVGGVARDNNLQLLTWVVELERILKLTRDVMFFIVGSDNERYGWLGIAPVTRTINQDR